MTWSYCAPLHFDRYLAWMEAQIQISDNKMHELSSSPDKHALELSQRKNSCSFAQILHLILEFDAYMHAEFKALDDELSSVKEHHAQLDRIKRLKDQGLSSDTTIEESRANYESIDAAYNRITHVKTKLLKKYYEIHRELLAPLLIEGPDVLISHEKIANIASRIGLGFRNHVGQFIFHTERNTADLLTQARKQMNSYCPTLVGVGLFDHAVFKMSNKAPSLLESLCFKIIQERQFARPHKHIKIIWDSSQSILTKDRITLFEISLLSYLGNGIRTDNVLETVTFHISDESFQDNKKFFLPSKKESGVFGYLKSLGVGTVILPDLSSSSIEELRQSELPIVFSHAFFSSQKPLVFETPRISTESYYQKLHSQHCLSLIKTSMDTYKASVSKYIQLMTAAEKWKATPIVGAVISPLITTLAKAFQSPADSPVRCTDGNPTPLLARKFPILTIKMSKREFEETYRAGSNFLDAIQHSLIKSQRSFEVINLVDIGCKNLNRDTAIESDPKRMSDYDADLINQLKRRKSLLKPWSHEKLNKHQHDAASCIETISFEIPVNVNAPISWDTDVILPKDDGKDICLGNGYASVEDYIIGSDYEKTIGNIACLAQRFQAPAPDPQKNPYKIPRDSDSHPSLREKNQQRLKFEHRVAIAHQEYDFARRIFFTQLPQKNSEYANYLPHDVFTNITHLHTDLTSKKQLSRLKKAFKALEAISSDISKIDRTITKSDLLADLGKIKREFNNFRSNVLSQHAHGEHKSSEDPLVRWAEEFDSSLAALISTVAQFSVDEKFKEAATNQESKLGEVEEQYKKHRETLSEEEKAVFPEIAPAMLNSGEFRHLKTRRDQYMELLKKYYTTYTYGDGVISAYHTRVRFSYSKKIVFRCILNFEIDASLDIELSPQELDQRNPNLPLLKQNPFVTFSFPGQPSPVLDFKETYLLGTLIYSDFTQDLIADITKQEQAQSTFHILTENSTLHAVQFSGLNPIFSSLDKVSHLPDAMHNPHAANISSIGDLTKQIQSLRSISSLIMKARWTKDLKRNEARTLVCANYSDKITFFDSTAQDYKEPGVSHFEFRDERE